MTSSPNDQAHTADLTELRKAEAEITAALKGPMSNTERALLVADRKDIRALISSTEPREAQDGR